MAKKATNNKTNGFEQNLWDTANKLRGSVESSEYKHVVLSLIFLNSSPANSASRMQKKW